MDDQQLMLGGAIAFAMGAVWILLSGDSSTEKSSKRMKSVAGHEKEGGALGFLKKEDTSARRKQIEESLGEMEQAQKDRNKKRKSLKAKLTQAAWSTTPQTFMLISLAVGVVAGAVAFIATGKPVAGLFAALLLGVLGPRLFLGRAINARQKKFLQGFPDAMDIIVRGVRSGLPLNDCLKIIAHESPSPICDEFKLVVQGEQVGVPIMVCLERMFDRMPLPEVNFFATVLNIQRSTGGNLGEALGNLSTVLRGRKLLREKIKALSSEAKASAMIIGALPIVVMGLVTMMEPDYLNELYTTPTGHRNLLISAVLMTVGTLVMRKMINFKI